MRTPCPQIQAEQEVEERRHVEARYHDVLELLQAEGGRIASLQVGALFCFEFRQSGTVPLWVIATV